MLTATPSSEQPKQSVGCTICNERFAKYTCPRCSAKTCSSQCSAAHKIKAKCSGVRNKAAYVPMNRYGYGALMSDYVYLEEVGRQITEWGRDIVRGGYMHGQQQRGRGRGRGRAHGRGSGSSHGGRAKFKRDVLKMQLDIRDIDMKSLPLGMEKRKLNQSHWDPKTKTAFMTIRFVLHPPPDLLRPLHIPPDPPITIMTHGNNIDTPLLSLIQKQISDKSKSKKDGTLSNWLRSLVFPDDPDTAESFVPPSCYMRAPPDPRRVSPSYHKLDCTQKLAVLLRQKEFVEFPIIEVCEDESFTGLVVDDRGLISRDRGGDGESGQKRRRLNVRKGKAAIQGLVGGYRSDEEEPEEIEAAPNVLSNLDGYADSDLEQEELKDDDEVLGEDTKKWDEDEETLDDDPASLLEKLKASGALPNETDDEDEVDWGDSD